MRLLLAALVVLWVAATASNASSPSTNKARTPLQSSGSLLGRVVDGTTGKPVAAAIVTLSQDFGRRSGTGSVHSASTLSDGTFALRLIEPGTYSLRAYKEGYLEGALGRLTASSPVEGRVTVLAGAATSNLVVRLWKKSSISGQVRDALGRPAARVSVAALWANDGCGALDVGVRSLTATDDNGDYRLWNLNPGRYLVAVVGASVSVPGATGPPTTYASSFVSPEAGMLIDVHAGDQRVGVDITLPAPKGFVIRGSIAGTHSEVPLTNVDLFPERLGSVYTSVPSASTRMQPDGAFSFPPVPAGRYVIRVLAFPPPVRGSGTQSVGSFTPLTSISPGMSALPTLWAEVPIELEDRDLDAHVELRTGGRIEGRVVFDSYSRRRVADIESTSVYVFTPSTSWGSREFQAARLDGDGRFQTVGLPPGQYQLFLPLIRSASGGLQTVSRAGLAVSSIRIGAEDVTGRLIRLQDASVGEVTVTLTDRPSAIRGVVEPSPALEAFGGQVYVFPTDRTLWAECGRFPLRLVRVPIRSAGEFIVEGLPAGSYFVAAVARAEDVWTSLDFLGYMAGFATTVQLDAGSSISVRLKPASGR